MKHNQRFFWLDVIRGLSAVAVCSGHLRAVIFVDYSELQAPSLFQKVFYAATGLGHQAVVVFFVLSGFFVGGSVLRKKNEFYINEYAIARLSRLWIVLVPTLILTFIVDRFIPSDVLSGYYYSIWSSGPSLDKIYSNNLLTFFGNIFFLQTILTPVFGTNGPLWSLANEFWYYVLFPLCAFATGKCYSLNKPSAFLRIAVSFIALILFILLPSGIQSGYFIWLLGVIIYVVFDRVSRKITIPLFVVGATIFFGALAYSKSVALQGILNIPSDILVGLGFSIFCLAMVNLPAPQNSKSLFMRMSTSLSEFSYSLYLSHFPFVVIIGALYYGSNQLLPDLIGFTHFVGWLGILLVIGVVFWWLFERKTNVFRQFVTKYLTNRQTGG